MKKKIILTIMILVMICASVFALSACGKNTYTVTVVSEDTVMGTVTGGGEYEQDEYITVVATPKSGYEFVAWYVDSTIENTSASYSFYAASNITLTAKFRAINTEYDVKFYLNYPNGNASYATPVTKRTEEGYISFVPTYSEYTFNGWWRSGGIVDGKFALTTRFDTSDKVAEGNLSLYADWVEMKTLKGQLDSPVVSVEGTRFSWSPIAGCESYQIKYTLSGNVAVTENVSSLTLFWMFPSSISGGNYKVEIRAMGNGYNTANSSYTDRYYSHAYLEKPEELSLNLAFSELTWKSVQYATHYDVRIDSDLIESDIIGTSCTIPELNAGSRTIQVRAYRAGEIESYAQITVEKFTLKMPQGITATYDVDYNMVLTWQAVQSANSYDVIFAGTALPRVMTNSITIPRTMVATAKAASASPIIEIRAFDTTTDRIQSNPAIIECAYIEYELNGGTFSESVRPAICIYGSEFSLPAATKNNLVYRGWYLDNALTGEAHFSYTLTEENDNLGTKFYALFNPTVTLTKNISVAGTVSGAADFRVGESVTLTATTNSGYTWLGWYDGDTKVSDGASLTYTFTMPSVSKTYTAKWQVASGMENFIFTSTPTTCTITGCQDKTVTSILVPDYVTSIGSSAFSGCSGLTSITLPFVGNTKDGTSNTHFGYIFGASSYSNNSSYVPSSLKTVIITGGTSIGSGAFSGCSGLTSITLPFVGANGTSTTASSSTLFGYIFGTGGYTGGTSVKQYYASGSYATYYVPTTLRSVTITGGNILYGAFDGCGGLTSITIPDGVTSIADTTFSGCSGLTSVTIGSGVTSIGSYAFSRCIGLTSITIPDTVTSIGNSAFINCSGLTSVTIGSGVTSIGDSAFYNCSGLTSVYITDIAAWCNISVYHSDSNPLNYANKLYLNGTLVTDLVIPDNVTKISNYAFRNCSGLTSITIPDSVTSIGYDAFLSCYKLVQITNLSGQELSGLPNNPEREIRTSLSVSFANTLSTDGDGISTYTVGGTKYAFGYTGTNSVLDLSGKGITAIYQYAFMSCSGLTSVTIPDSVVTIGSSAFRGCSGLTSITLPFVGANGTSTTASSSTLFGYIFGTYSYTGGTKVKQYYYQGYNATYYVPTTLRSVTITGGNILYGAFSYCSGLTSITIPESVVTIDYYAFSGCSGLTSITIPDTVTSIGSSAFSSCSGLTSITIPDTVTSIGSSAFENCRSLTSITIPDSVVTIGSSAFSYCSGLTSITLPFVGANGTSTTASSSTLFGYIFGTSSYTGGTAVKQYYASSSSTTYYIPATLKNVTITGGNILYGAFYGCSGLTSVTIESGVTSIGSNAYYGCSGLTSITLPFVGANGTSTTASSSTLFGYIFGTDSYTGGTRVYQYYASGYNATYYIPATLKNVTITGGKILYGAFYGCSGLTSITIPDSVTSIGDYAFLLCSSLTSVYITDIAAWCNISFASDTSNPLYYAKKLYLNGTLVTDLVIPDSVTSIGSNAFVVCSGLTSVIIPDTVTSIGDRAFYMCIGLTSITVDSGNTAYKSEDGVLFTKDGKEIVSYPAGKTGLSYTIPAGVTIIGSSAFAGCSGLTSITIPVDVTSIGTFAFSNCSGLTSITIPDSVVTIGSYAFSVCSKLTSITIPDSVTSIGSYAFSVCSKLTSITIPDSVTSIGSSAFWGCSGLTFITLPFVGANGTSTTASSSTLFGHIFGGSYPGGTEVKQYYASGNYDYTTYYIPATLKNVTITGGNILYGAFYNCSGLTSVIIGSGVTSIGYGAFSGCSGLTSITLPFVGYTKDETNNTHFGYIFGASSDSYNSSYVPSGLKTVIITGGTSIGSSAFSGCSGLTSITIPNSVTSIGYNAFSGTAWYENKADGLVYAGKVAYKYKGTMPAGTTIELFGGIKGIADYAFYGCSGLTSIRIPDSVTSIGQRAFYGCSGLTSIRIPDSITSIGVYAFSGTAWYNEQPDGLVYAGKVAYKYKGTMPSGTSITLKEGTTEITATAFSDCTGLTSITIGSGVTSIGSSAFYYCSGLTSITIPDSVTSIGYDAFLSCYKLVQITNLSGQELSGLPNNPEREIRTSLSVSFANTLSTDGDGVITYMVGGTKYAIGYTGTNSALDLSGKGITAIYQYAFMSCSGLTSITIPDSVTSIENWAFDGCSGLTSVIIGSGVTSIGYGAFSGCSGLTSITFSDTTTWYRTTKSSYTGGTQTYVTTPSTNATYFKSTYYNYYWYKK